MFTLNGGCILQERECERDNSLQISNTIFEEDPNKALIFPKLGVYSGRKSDFWMVLLNSRSTCIFFFYSWFLSLLFKYRGLIFKADWQFDTTQCFYSHSLLSGFVPYKSHLSKYKYTLQIVIFFMRVFSCVLIDTQISNWLKSYLN